jgi:REP element-mobilizing transposase RayT
MSDYRHKRHNVSVLIYHIVCPAKYRRVIFDAEVDTVLKDVCLDIAQRYEIAFLEIGTDKDHVHFLVQSVPSYSPTKIVKMIKSLTAREVFHRVPTVKKRLWGGEFWSKGYFTLQRHFSGLTKFACAKSRRCGRNRQAQVVFDVPTTLGSTKHVCRNVVVGFISTVGRHGNEEVIRQYVKQQGNEKGYQQLHRQDVQLELF